MILANFDEKVTYSYRKLLQDRFEHQSVFANHLPIQKNEYHNDNIMKLSKNVLFKSSYVIKPFDHIHLPVNPVCIR